MNNPAKNVQEDVSLGEKLKFFRKRCRLSQMDLELEAELSPGVISRMENNLTTPTTETLMRVAVALELDNKETAYLFEVNLYITSQQML